MKKILSFNLFESKVFDYKDAISRDKNSHINFALNGIGVSNQTKSFKNWLTYNAYLKLLLPDSELPRDTKLSDGQDPGFNFWDEIEKTTLGKKSVNWFIKQMSEEFKSENPMGIYDVSMRKFFIDCLNRCLNNVINDLFFPGNLPNIQKLKFLDFFPDNELESYGISKLVENSMDLSVSNFEKMERIKERISEKYFGLLKIISNHNLEFFVNMKFPTSMVNYIVDYFNSSENSFKNADDLRKSNIGIYNRIKEILPEIDTSADLGDLGF